TLLRVDPPLCHASGTLSSWVFHLGIPLSIVTTGSHVPRESLSRARATFTPVIVKAVSRSRLDRIPGQRLEPAFDDVPTLSTPHRWFTRVRLLSSYLTGSRPAFSRTLTTWTLDPCSFGRFGTWSCNPIPRDLPSSLTQHGVPGRLLKSSLHTFVAHSRLRSGSGTIAP